MHDTNVVNVKIYDGQGITLFSLDAETLGEDISACKCFGRVLVDGTFSELMHTGLGGHGAGDAEHLHSGSDVDLLSTIIRLNVLTPDLVASDSVLEVQSDVTGLIAPIIATRQETSLVVGMPLFVLYLLMVALVVFGHMTIMRRDRQAAKFAARAAVTTVQLVFDKSLVTLSAHDDGKQEPIVGDSQKLVQVLENLLPNAARFTPAGGAVKIRGSGVGMPRTRSSRRACRSMRI